MLGRLRGVIDRADPVPTRANTGSSVRLQVSLGAADYALRQAMATHAERPQTRVTRYYARDQQSYTGPMKFTVFNTAPETN